MLQYQTNGKVNSVKELTMKLLVFYGAVMSFASAGIIQQDSDEGSHLEYHDHNTHDHDDRPTSYQNIHIKHYHSVPVFIKKEFKHLLDHPVSTGDSSSSLEVHHGGKYDQGYSLEDSKQSLNDFGGHEEDNGGYGGNFESRSENEEKSDQLTQEQGAEGHYSQYGHYDGQYGGENQGQYQGDENLESAGDHY